VFHRHVITIADSSVQRHQYYLDNHRHQQHARLDQFHCHQCTARLAKNSLTSMTSFSPQHSHLAVTVNGS